MNLVKQILFQLVAMLFVFFLVTSWGTAGAMVVFFGFAVALAHVTRIAAEWFFPEESEE